MTLDWRDWSIAAAGVGVVASGFLPWWRVAGPFDEVRDLTAWQASTRWTAALLLTALTTLVWLVFRLAGRPGPLVARVVLLLVVGLAGWLVVQQWNDVQAWTPPAPIVPTPEPSGAFVLRVDSIVPYTEPTPLPEDLGVRDHLRSADGPAVRSRFAWGTGVGVACMALVAVGLLIAGRRSPPPKVSPEA